MRPAKFPHSSIAERAVVSCCVWDADSVPVVFDICRVVDFVDPDMAIFVRAIFDLWSRGIAIDSVIVEQHLRDNGFLADDRILVWRDVTSSQTIECVPSPANAEYYAKIVNEKAIRRRLFSKIDSFQKVLGSEKPVAQIAKDVARLAGGVSAIASKEFGRNEVSGLVTKRLSDIEPTPIIWLWLYRFAMGKLNLLVGDPGVGKSFLSLDLASRVTVGGCWPDGNNLPDEVNRAPLGKVILLTSEDGLADTVRPRLDHMGGDCSKVVVVKGVRLPNGEQDNILSCTKKSAPMDFFDLSRHLELLEGEIERQENVRLVVIDPLSAYYGTKTDTHRDSAVRSILSELAEIAERHNICIIGIAHLRKSTSEAAIYRVIGSIGQIAAARTSWVIRRDQDDEERRKFVCLKNNLSLEKPGLAFRIEGGSVVYEDEILTETAEQLFYDEQNQGPKLQEAIEFLDSYLADDPNPKVVELDDKARKKGISTRTLRRAKKALGIVSRPHPSGFWRCEKSDDRNN